MRVYNLKKLGLMGLAFLFVFLFISSDIQAMLIEEEARLSAGEAARQLSEGQKQPYAEYVEGEVLIKVKEGVDPQSVLEKIDLKAENLERIHSLKPVISKFKKNHTLEKDEGGWYWFKGKKYQEPNEISDEEIFQEAYAKMPPAEKSLYRSYKAILPKGISVEKAVIELEKDPDVEYAEPNYIRKTQAIPNDPYYHTVGSWGQAYYDLWGVRKIQCEQAWDISQGENVVVAVIDSGVDYNHKDIFSNIWVNEAEFNGTPGIDDDDNGYVDDVRGWDFAYDDNDPMDGHGHGTHCAGTIAAIGNNSSGVIGVAPMAKIMAVKGLLDSSGGQDTDLVEAVKYAVDNNAHILSNSWGGLGTSRVIEDIFNYAYQKGCVSIAAAGNDNMNVASHTPANVDSVIAVASTDQDDIKSDFSNLGYKIDVSAPGGGSGRMADSPSGEHYYINILSLKAESTDMYLSAPNYTPGEFILGDSYYRARGTSMACPHVAGLAALIKSIYPNDSPDAVRSRILAGADNISDLNPLFVDLLGSGRINAYNSLTVSSRPILKILAVEKDNIFPGESGTVVVQIKNFWEDALGVEAVLSTNNPWVSVQNNIAVFGDMLPGQTATNNNNPFTIVFSPETPFGEVIDFNLKVTSQGGYEETLSFTLTVTSFMDVGPQTNLKLQDMMPYSTVMKDYDNDGYSDIFFTGFDNQHFYRNARDGSFVEVSDETGVHGGIISWTSIFMDIDNDGYQDLFIGDRDSGLLFLNKGDGTFTDISEASGIAPRNDFCPAITIDYNDDGFLDIFGGRFLKLLKNNGDNTFTDITDETGLPHGYPNFWGQIVSFDYDNDDDQDLIFSDYNGPPSLPERLRLYSNNGDGTFIDVTAESQIDTSRGGPSGIAVGDYDNDGYIDIFFTEFWDWRADPNNNALYKNNGDGTFTDVTKEAGNVGLGTSGHNWGTDFFDYDNDGDLDLHITDCGTRENPSNTLFRNNGNGTFTEITDIAFPQEISPAWAAACMGDYDNDGDLDIYAPTGLGGITGAFLKNMVGTQNNWIKIKLEGTASNRDAYGARVYVKTGDLTQLREIHTSSVETQPIHFGLGNAASIDEMEIRWPSGVVQKLNNAGVNQLITVVEVQMPYIASVEPHSGSAGDIITITGENFGLYLGDLNYDPACDFNGDGKVMGGDYGIFAGAWGSREGDPKYNPDCDFNEDAKIDMEDYAIFAAAYKSRAADPNYNPACDFNRDGKVNSADFMIFIVAYRSRRGSSYVEFNNGIVAKMVSWSDTEITCIVPYGATNGSLYVVTDRGRSNDASFTVIP